MRTSFVGLLFLILIFFSFTGFSEENTLLESTIKNEGIDFTKAEASALVRKLLNEIPQTDPSLYPEKIASYRETFENYFEYKKGVCNATFSTVIVDDKEGIKQNKVKDKLSKEERSLCIKDLKELHISFINNMFTWRKKYLDFIHESRLKELTTIRQNAINEIQKSYERK